MFGRPSSAAAPVPRLPVFLRQGAGQSSQELVQGHMDLRGEVLGVDGGQHNQDVVRENL